MFKRFFDRLAQERAADRRMFQDTLETVARLAERQTDLQIEQAKVFQGMLKMFDYSATPTGWVANEQAELLQEAEVNEAVKQSILDMTRVDML